MRKLTFAVVSTIAATFIRVTNWTAARASALILWITAMVNQLVARASYAIMRSLDPAACSQIESMVEAMSPSSELVTQQTELQLLDAANKIKVHAETTGSWTDHHTEGLAAVSNALLNECDWEEEHIHDYMKRLVESIDGLEYGLEEG